MKKVILPTSIKKKIRAIISARNLHLTALMELDAAGLVAWHEQGEREIWRDETNAEICCLDDLDIVLGDKGSAISGEQEELELLAQVLDSYASERKQDRDRKWKAYQEVADAYRESLSTAKNIQIESFSE